MTIPPLTAVIDGQVLPVDLAQVSALDAVVYEQATGHALDLKIASLIETAVGIEQDEWRLVDRAVIKWLFVRQSVNPDAGFADVLKSVTFISPPADEPAGGPVAPEPLSDEVHEKPVERAAG